MTDEDFEALAKRIAEPGYRQNAITGTADAETRHRLAALLAVID